jgi:hypothetical protein
MDFSAARRMGRSIDKDNTSALHLLFPPSTRAFISFDRTLPATALWLAPSGVSLTISDEEALVKMPKTSWGLRPNGPAWGLYQRQNRPESPRRRIKVHTMLVVGARNGSNNVSLRLHGLAENQGAKPRASDRRYLQAIKERL